MPTSKKSGFGIDISFSTDFMSGSTVEDAIINEDVMRRIEEIADNALAQGLGEYGLENTNLASETSINRRKDKVILSCNSPYAVYVEFGTGIIGAQNGSPETPPSGYEAGSGTYHTTKSGKIGWFYPTGYVDEWGNDEIRFTQGQTARPFMWRAQKIIEGEAERILERAVDEYFAKRRTYGWRE